MPKRNAHRLADRLVLAAVRLTRWLRAADPSPRLSGPQASALAIVIHANGITPSAIAELEQVRRPTIARVIAELESLGLIERSINPKDRRSVTLHSTPSGEALFVAGQLRRIEPLAARIEALSKTDSAAIEAALPILERMLGAPLQRTAIEAGSARAES